MNSSELIVETRPVGPLQCNCSILGDPESRKAIIVDPGGDADVLLQRLVELDLQVERIIHTHAHLDHFLASGKVKVATGANLALHKDDLFLWDKLEDQCRMFGIPYETLFFPFLLPFGGASSIIFLQEASSSPSGSTSFGIL